MAEDSAQRGTPWKQPYEKVLLTSGARPLRGVEPGRGRGRAGGEGAEKSKQLAEQEGPGSILLARLHE
jgi:hypothetical protein